MSAAAHHDPPGLAASNDSALLAAIAARRPDALEAVYDRHAPALYGLALVIARDRDLAEDAVLGAFTELWRTCDSIDVQRSSLHAALAEAVYTRCRHPHPETRSRSRPKVRLAGETTFARLSRRQRELVALIVLGEHDLRRAAHCTGDSEPAAAQLLSSALHAQREDPAPARRSPTSLPAGHRRASHRSADP